MVDVTLTFGVLALTLSVLVVCIVVVVVLSLEESPSPAAELENFTFEALMCCVIVLCVPLLPRPPNLISLCVELPPVELPKWP